MKIVAITKTYQGHEFSIASLESIYAHCSAIVYVHSNVSWSGSKEPNTVAPLIEEWCEKNDVDKKVHNEYLDTTIQDAQYQHALNYISKKKLSPDMLMLIDTDEVWTEEAWKLAYEAFEKNPGVNAFRSFMRTYLKSPFFQIHPTINLNPTCFIRKGVPMLGVRGSDIPGTIIVTGMFFHHFTSVR